MGKFLLQGSYTEQGLKGVLKEGGSGRVKAVEQLVKGVGGKLEVLYFAHGSDDYFIIVDVPDSVSAIAISLIVNASGAVKNRTTVLITPEELDRATKVTLATGRRGSSSNTLVTNRCSSRSMKTRDTIVGRLSTEGWTCMTGSSATSVVIRSWRWLSS